jgi:hypothetical protein
MSSSTLTQIIASSKGGMAAYLTEGATNTLFKGRYVKTTNFAMEHVNVPASTTVAFGNEITFSIPRQGDLLSSTYLVLDIPGIVAVDDPGASSGFCVVSDCNPCKESDEKAFGGDKSAWLKSNYGAAPDLDCCGDQVDCPSTICAGELDDTWAHYANAIGQAAIRNAKVTIGGTVMAQVYGELLFIMEEMCGLQGKKLHEMTGRRFSRAALCCDSRAARRLWVPLGFWWTKSSSAALPLASLAFHGITISVELEPLSKLICVSKSGVRVNNVATGSPIMPTDLRAHLECCMVMLETDERNRFVQTPHDQLYKEAQRITHASGKSGQIRMHIPFNLSVTALYVVVKRKCLMNAGSFGNFSGVGGKDPIKDMTLLLNNSERMRAMPGQWFRTVMPYQHANNIPDSYIHLISFALDSCADVPNGACNFSRVDNTELQITLQDGLAGEDVEITVYAENFNIISYNSGMAGKKFAA